MTRTRRLRELLDRGCVAMPGAFNAYSARLIERAGFDAVYVSGAGISNATAGVPDVGLLGLEEVAQLAGYVADAVAVPILVDADTGFGGASNVARTVRMFQQADIAGLHLEDQEFPKRCGHVPGKSVVPADEMCARIEAAVSARSDKDFLILARTDARAVEGFDSAVARAKDYLKAGADGIFPEALQTEDEFAKFATHVGGILLANMTEFGKGPLLSVPTLAKLGYKIVIFPQTAFRVASKAIQSAMADLRRDGSQKNWLDRMQPRDELYEILGYDPMAQRWPK